MFEYAFMRNAFMISVLISLICPLIGMFLVLRRYSMIGDALSHASLAGVATGLLLDWNPILSAFCLTSFFGLLIEVLREKFRRYAELTLVIVLSLSVGIAITIISSGLVHANVDSFLFGSILTVSQKEVLTVLVLTIISLLTILGLFPQLVMLSFDEDGARIAGVKARAINYIFSILVGSHHFRIHPDCGDPGHQFPDCPAGGHRPPAAEGVPPNPVLVGGVQLHRHLVRAVCFLLAGSRPGGHYRHCVRGAPDAGDFL